MSFLMENTLDKVTFEGEIMEVTLWNFKYFWLLLTKQQAGKVSQASPACSWRHLQYFSKWKNDNTWAKCFPKLWSPRSLQPHTARLISMVNNFHLLWHAWPHGCQSSKFPEQVFLYSITLYAQEQKVSGWRIKPSPSYQTMPRSRLVCDGSLERIRAVWLPILDRRDRALLLANH